MLPALLLTPEQKIVVTPPSLALAPMKLALSSAAPDRLSCAMPPPLFSQMRSSLMGPVMLGTP